MNDEINDHNCELTMNRFPSLCFESNRLFVFVTAIFPLNFGGAMSGTITGRQARRQAVQGEQSRKTLVFVSNDARDTDRNMWVERLTWMQRQTIWIKLPSRSRTQCTSWREGETRHRTIFTDKWCRFTTS